MSIDVVDIEAVLLRALTSSEMEYVDRLIAMAEGSIEDALPGFSIAEGTATDEVIHPGDPDVMWTSRYPVTALTSVTRDGATLSTTSLDWNDKGRLSLGSRVVLNEFEIVPFSWRTGGVYEVTYEYGGADVSSAVAYMVASSLRGRAANAEGVESESLGAYSVTYGSNQTLAFPAPPYDVLRRWSRNRQVSVPLVRYR